MDFETEEQQVEALKKWWKENGKQVVLGGLIGLGLVVGWRYYLQYTQQQVTQASAIYDQMKNNNAADSSALLKKLADNYPGTSYLQAARLLQAKRAYESQKADEAVALLDQIIESAEGELGLVARERKARILLEMSKYSDALSVLSVNDAGSYSAIFNELKGDVYVAQNETEKAKAAYDLALKDSASSNALLKMKRNDLGGDTMDSAL